MFKLNLSKRIFTSKIRGIHKEMNLNPITLKFRGKREQEFKNYYFEYSLDFVRVAILLSMVYYMIFYPLDIVVFPNYKLEFLFIRLFVCFVIGFSVFILSYHKKFRKYWQGIIYILVQISGLSIIAMLLFSTRHFQHEYYVGLILILMYNYIFSKLKFVWASLSGWSLFVFYIIIMNIGFDVPFIDNYMNTFFFASANVFGMMGSYFFEYYTRREFYTINLLNREKSITEELNKNLEIKVSERTGELEQLNRKLTENNKALNLSEKELTKHKSKLEELVKKRTGELELKIKELNEKNEELERFNNLFVNREFRIKELREEVKSLKEKISG